MAKGKILCVEDNPGDARIIKELFDDNLYNMYEISFATSIESVLNVIKDVEYEAILLDLSLPDSSGLDTLERMKTLTPETPIIVLTGLLDEKLCEEIIQNGAQDYFTKGKITADLLTRSIRYARDRYVFVKKIKETQEQFINLVENISDGILVIDEDGLIKYLNHSCEKIFSKPKAKLLNQSFGFPISIHDYTEITIHGGDGVIKTAEMHSSEVIWEDKLCYLAALRDITERKLIEQQLLQKSEIIETQNEELKQINKEYKLINDELFKSKIKAEESDKLKSAFLANMSHEIRTPMNGIVGFADLLNNPGLRDRKRKEYTSIIIERSNHLLNIVNDILDISKIEAGLVTVKNESVSINKLMGELWTYYSNNEKLKKIRLEKKCGLDGLNVNIYADKTKITQVLNNLLNNAIKFTNQGNIAFGYELKENMLEFFVQDTGIGIPDDHIEKIFERFRQVDLELTKNYGGTGLGLSISKELVRIMGGKIWIESELGVGTKVLFDIPYIRLDNEAGLTSEHYKAFNERNIKGKSVLIVDDDAVNLHYLREIMSELKLNIFEAKNGLDAVVKFKKNKCISLILMDIKMPVMNGIEATKLIKSNSQNIKVVMQTAYAMNAEKEMALKEGCDDYISKPLNKEKVIEVIKRYL